MVGAKSCRKEPGVHSKKYARIIVFFRPMRFIRGTAAKAALAAPTRGTVTIKSRFRACAEISAHQPKILVEYRAYSEGWPYTLVLVDEKRQCQNRAKKVVVVAEQTEREPNDKHCSKIN